MLVLFLICPCRFTINLPPSCGTHRSADVARRATLNRSLYLSALLSIEEHKKELEKIRQRRREAYARPVPYMSLSIYLTISSAGVHLSADSCLSDTDKWCEWLTDEGAIRVPRIWLRWRRAQKGAREDTATSSRSVCSSCSLYVLVDLPDPTCRRPVVRIDQRMLPVAQRLIAVFT
jgi:hypothetical protein